jgi:hypothetical protein
MGRIRSHGSSIRKGEATHTGIIPFLKLAEAATKVVHKVDLVVQQYTFRFGTERLKRY